MHIVEREVPVSWLSAIFNDDHSDLSERDMDSFRNWENSHSGMVPITASSIGLKENAIVFLSCS